LRGAVSKTPSAKTCFLLSIKEVSSGWLTIPPCCIQREADELANLIFAVFAENNSVLCLFYFHLNCWFDMGVPLILL
jgi:hypothetical protein